MAEGGTNESPSPQQHSGGGSQRGRRLGGFEIVERIGKGAMGAVFKARQVSMDRFVALKILPRRLAQSKEFVQRFLREARSAAKLRHPNIVQAYDVGFADGFYFFAMELVDGETLSQIVRRDGPLEQNRALAVMKQIASALAAAHEVGIVHRDIKPLNIMIDKKGEVRVTDFGLAKRTEGDINVTADGRVVGTPAYAAPEIAKGAEADARSDLYSLGATIFYALSGRPPFEGNNFSEVIVKQATEPAPQLATVVPSTDRRLCYVVDRLLSKNPEDRHPSAEALLADIEGLGALRSPGAGAVIPDFEIDEDAAPEPERLLLPRFWTAGRIARRALRVVLIIAATVGIGSAARKWLPTLLSSRGLGEERGARGKTAQERPRAVRAGAGRPKHERLARAKEEALAEARRRVGDLLRQAETAVAAGDFAKARAAVQAAQALKVPDLAGALEAELREIESAEREAAAWARWKDIKLRAAGLADAGKYGQALGVLATAKGLPLKEAAELVASERAAIEAARQRALDAIQEAYARESDKVWAMLGKRDYAGAEKLLAGLREGSLDGAPVPRKHLPADKEAIELLREFWGMVEAGLAKRKGTISILGAIGNIVGVERGTITIQTLKGPVTRQVRQLTAMAALHYASVGSGGGPRARLAEAIFRIAEADNLDRGELLHAEKLLAEAGNPPGLTFYKDRLDTLTKGAAEVAARKVWAGIEAVAKSVNNKAEARRLLAYLDAFELKYGTTKFFASVISKIAALRTRGRIYAGVPGVSLRLFNGESLKNWRIVSDGEYQKHGPVRIQAGELLLERGNPHTAVAWRGGFPHEDYEVQLTLRRLEGQGFCTIVFPAGEATCTLNLGGSGGKLLGLSLIDGPSANENETQRTIAFEDRRWYHVRLQVTRVAIEVWLDGERLVYLPLKDRRLKAGRAEPAGPFGIVSENSTVAVRSIRLRRILPSPSKPRATLTSGGQRQLFDGKTLKGWNELRGAGGWRVENGNIVGEGPNCPLLVTTSTFRPPYQLALEVMGPEATDFPSGLLFGVQGRPAADGRLGYSVALCDLKGRALALARGFPGDNPTPRLIWRHPAVRFHGGQWHTLVLIVARTSVTLLCDGHLIFRHKVEHTTAGRVGLAARNTTRFRNIRISKP